MVREAAADGSAATLGQRLPLDGAHVRWNGTYYRVRVEDGGTADAERYVVGFEPVDALDGPVREATDLSGEDRRAAELAYRAHRMHQRRDCNAERCPNREYVYEGTPDPGSSALVPTPGVRHVRVGNVTFRVTADRRTVDLDRTRYELDRIGTDEAALRAAAVRDLTLEDGSEPARLFERAAENGSYRVRAGRASSVPEAFYRVVEACGFDPEDPLYGRGPASTVVRYEGRYYRVVLDGETSAA